MSHVTFAVPEELPTEMRAHPEIEWAGVARAAFRVHLRRLEVYDRLFAESRVTERNAVELGRKMRRVAFRGQK